MESEKSGIYNNLFIIIRTQWNMGAHQSKQNQNGKISEADPATFKTHGTWYSRRTIRHSFSQLVEVEPKHCVVKMKITYQKLTKHRTPQSRDTGL